MVKPGYKQTEIGVIPEDWDLILFEDCFSVLSNNTLSRAELNYNGGELQNIHYGDILVKFSAVTNCGAERLPYVNAELVKKVSKGFLRDGDIVIADTAEDNTVGRATEVVAVNGNKVVSGLHTIPCRPKDDKMFVPMWLGYFINHNTYHNQLLPYITGIKVSSISKSAIAGTMIAVPKSDEQMKIVAALSDIDALITNLEKLIAKKKAIKQGAMQELLTGKRRLPGFVKTWDEYLLGNIVRLINGRAYAQEELLDSGKYPVLRLGNLFTNEHWYYSNLELPEKQYCVRGDLIYAWSATFGPRVWKGEKSIFHYHIWKLQLADIVDRDFLYHYLCYDVNVLISELQGGTMAHLTKATMEKRTVIIPQIDEQIAIAKTLSDMDADIEDANKKLKKYREIKSGMMSELLTGRIRLV